MSFEDSAGLGVLNHYGPRDVDSKFGAQTGYKGDVVEVEWVFSYDDLPDAGTDKLTYTIPDNAYIVQARLEVLTAFAGGTSYDIGLQESDGTEIDNDGLWDALALADINTAGNWSDASTHGGANSGTLIDSSITEAGQLVVDATGTFTAGKARVILEYVVPRS